MQTIVLPEPQFTDFSRNWAGDFLKIFLTFTEINWLKWVCPFVYLLYSLQPCRYIPDLEHFCSFVNFWIILVFIVFSWIVLIYIFASNSAIKTGLFHAKLDQVNHKVLLE